MSGSIRKVLLLVAFFSLAVLTVAAMADHGLQNAADHANENANLPDLPATAVDHPEPNENANANASQDDGDDATAQQNGNSDKLNHGQCVSATAHETDPPKGETVREVAQNNDLVGPDCVEDSESNGNNGQGAETSEAAKAGGRDFGQSKKAENNP
jgi:hypothetical protein